MMLTRKPDASRCENVKGMVSRAPARAMLKPADDNRPPQSFSLSTYDALERATVMHWPTENHLWTHKEPLLNRENSAPLVTTARKRMEYVRGVG